MPDVATKAKSTQDITCGDVVINSMPNGNNQTYTGHNYPACSPEASGIAAKLDTRFDDPQYYSA
jgi:hypothetical protein